MNQIAPSGDGPENQIGIWIRHDDLHAVDAAAAAHIDSDRMVRS